MNEFGMFLAVTRTSDLAPEYQDVVVEPGLPWFAIGMVLLIIGLLIVGYWFVRRLRVPALAISDDLTLELCRGHGIGLSHRAVLDHVARTAGLSHTAELFLSVRFYDQAVAVASSRKRLRGRQRDLLHELRRLLFDDTSHR